ncbi:MAG: zinc ribbon domain-containing protein [Cyanobacteria bacterium P01_H01_bin.105]
MPSCPRCHQSISGTAITCSNCGLELKAHGHPGIELYRSQKGTYLCESCSYHQDDTCTFPQRPQATTCTLYQSAEMLTQRPTPSEIYLIPWWRKHLGWLLLAGVVMVSLLLTLL